jgi:UDP-glucose 4-epimerase
LIDRGWPLPFRTIRNRRSFVFVDSVVGMVILCLKNPLAYGEAFIAADDEVLSTAEICRSMAEARGKRIMIWGCPVWLLRLLGKLGDILGILLRRSPGIDSYSVERLVGSLECSNAHAKAILGWSPSGSFHDAIRTVYEDTV